MAVHTTEQRAFIVRSLAACVSPDAVVLQFASLWKDTSCALADVAACERHRLAADWQSYFDAARAEFLEVPTADKRIRIAILHRMAVHAEGRQAYQTAAELLEQIAKEQGDFWNKGAASSQGGSSDTIVSITRTIVDPVESRP